MTDLSEKERILNKELLIKEGFGEDRAEVMTETMASLFSYFDKITTDNQLKLGERMVILLSLLGSDMTYLIGGIDQDALTVMHKLVTKQLEQFTDSSNIKLDKAQQVNMTMGIMDGCLVYILDKLTKYSTYKVEDTLSEAEERISSIPPPPKNSLVN